MEKCASISTFPAAALTATLILLTGPYAAATSGADAGHQGPEDRPLSRLDDLCAEGTTIGKISVERINVFDSERPDLDKKIYRVINTVHKPMLTRERTVRSLLTVERGEACTIPKLKEAERELRRLGFIQDAWVVPVARHGDEVDLEVRVQDSWSTKLGFSISNEGGQSATSVRIKESNLFGLGSTLEWETESDQDRDEQTLRYMDPALFGSRWRLDLETSDNSDGNVNAFGFDLPFYRLDQRHSYDTFWSDFSRNERVYVGDDEVDRWNVAGNAMRLGYASSPGGFEESSGKLLRWKTGLRYDEQIWTLAEEDRDGSIDRTDLRPVDREAVLAGAGFTWRRVDIRRVRHFESARRVEDLDLTQLFRFDVEHSLSGLSENEVATVGASYKQGFFPGEKTVVLLEGGYNAEMVDAAWINRVASFSGRMYRRVAFDQTIVVKLDADVGTNLDGTQRFLLGGDTGLRAFPTRAFSGDRRVLLTGEHRYFAPWEMWNWLRLGLVGFFDVGAAWDDEQGFDDSLINGDVGIGLRGFLLPASGNTTLHLNFAYGLGSGLDEDESRFRITFSTASSF